jgi:hypothetical protein
MQGVGGGFWDVRAGIFFPVCPKISDEGMAVDFFGAR